MKRILFLVIFLLALTFNPSSDTQAKDEVPRFENSACLIEVPDESSIECGTLITLEDYDQPDGRTIRLPAIIIRSQNENPSRQALLFTEGGPGYSSLRSVWWLASSGFGKDRDIIILEQRGNKFAEPSLACDFSMWWEEKQGQTPCLDNLRQRGIVLENYTTSSIAADLNALSQVLDYNAWILYGTSYSTRLMQLVMAQYPHKVRSVVLQSISPVADTRYLHDPEHTARALRIMFDDCAVDPTCSKAYPDLESKFHALVRKLNDEPVEFEITYPGNPESFTFEVNGETLIGWMDGNAFYGPAYPAFETAYLPLLIDQVSQGNTHLLYPWAKNAVSHWGDDAFSWGLYFAANCQDDAPSIDSMKVDAQVAAYPELDGYYRHRDELAICSAWGLEAETSLPTEPVVSDIPVLVLAGTYDPITPPEWSQSALVNLSQYTFVEFPSSGHNVLADNPCAREITAVFLENPDEELDLSCVEAAPRPEFVLPNELIVAPDMYEIQYWELGYSMLEENLFLSSWLTLIGTGLIALIAGLVIIVRRSKQTSSDTPMRIALPLLIVLAATALVWGYALRFTLQSIAETTPNVLRFGLPTAYWWLFIIAIFIGLMTVLLITITVLAWTRGYWAIIGRIALTLTSLAAIIFCGVLAKWGFFTALFG